MNKRWIEILGHLAFWLFSLWMLNQTFAFESIEVREVDGMEQEIYIKDYRLFYYFTISLLAKVFFVYINAFWVLPVFFKKRNYSLLIAQTFFSLAAAIILEFCFHSIYSHFQANEDSTFRYFSSMWQLNALFYLFYYGGTVAYVLSKNWWRNEKIKETLLQEKMHAELSFLKSQINPHFLFNTLNNLYTLAERKENSDLAQGISELSNLMRYILYDGKADRVRLEKEINFLKSIIEIQQLRIAEEDDVFIALDIEGDYTNQTIAPLILVPFVENAFKHGIDPKESSIIKMYIKVEGNKLLFQVSNTNFKYQKNELETHSGIGLKNVRRRLTLIYPNQHSLKIEDGEMLFKVSLELNLEQ